MHRLLKKEQILTIPNLLSLVRLAMIPVIVWLYCKKEAYLAAVAMIVLSGLTDIADGIIARKCNMVSDFGKILDPVADKLTQAALILCLATRYQLMIPLIIEFALREAAMLAMGYAAIKKKDTINSSQWFGKLTTAMMYAVTSLLILLPNIPLWCANAMIVFCSVTMLVSFVMYALFYKGFFSGRKEARI